MFAHIAKMCPLCREIVEAHGGRIKLANRRDKGLIVEFSIPG